MRALALIALFTGFAFESVGALLASFFSTLGLGSVETGWLMSFGLPLMIFSSFVGGKLADRWGEKRVFGWAILATVLSSLFLIFYGSHGGGIRYAAVGFFYFTIGGFVSSSYAFYMGQSAGPWATTQFTLLMAMTNLCESLAAFASGRWASARGYELAVILCACMALFGWVVLLRYPALKGKKHQV